MAIKWTRQAYADLERLRWFLSEKSERAAEAAVRRIVKSSLSLNTQSRRGPVLEKYLPREVRRLLIGDFELRYEILDGAVYVVAIFHTREER